MLRFLKNVWILAALFFVLLASIFGGWWYWNHRGPRLDDLIKEALANAELTTTYTQQVVTETDIGDRHIQVAGEYILDEKDIRFSSHATTTLTLPDGTEHTFSLQTITVGEDMYTRTLSQSPLLNLTVPATGEWKSFKVNAIPAEYRDIATPRPPIDNLALFRKDGKYLTIKEARRDGEKNSERLARYVFGLSSIAFTETTGPVSMIAERVGVHGTVEVWVRESDKSIRFIRFSNPPYSSETKISTSPLRAITKPL